MKTKTLRWFNVILLTSLLGLALGSCGGSSGDPPTITGDKTVNLHVMDTRREPVTGANIYINSETTPYSTTDSNGETTINMNGVTSVHVVANDRVIKSYYNPSWTGNKNMRIRWLPQTAGTVSGDISNTQLGDILLVTSSNGFNTNSYSTNYAGDPTAYSITAFPGNIIDITIIPSETNVMPGNAFFGIAANINGSLGGSNFDIPLVRNGGKEISVSVTGILGGAANTTRYKIWNYTNLWGSLAESQANATLTIPYANRVYSIDARSSVGGRNQNQRKQRIMYNSDADLSSASATLDIMLTDFGVSPGLPVDGSINVSTNPTFTWSLSATDTDYVKVNLYKDIGGNRTRVWESVVYGSTTSVSLPSVYTLDVDTTYYYNVWAFRYIRDANNKIIKQEYSGRKRVYFSTGPNETVF